MELLSYPKTDFLLEASLASLHSETIAWLNELKFWSDEISFFYKLMQKKESDNIFPSKELADAEKELVKLNSGKLDRVRTGVVNHERLLSSVARSTSLTEDETYREEHRRLLGDMHSLHMDIRAYKKNIFSFIYR